MGTAAVAHIRETISQPSAGLAAVTREVSRRMGGVVESLRDLGNLPSVLAGNYDNLVLDLIPGTIASIDAFLPQVPAIRFVDALVATVGTSNDVLDMDLKEYIDGQCTWAHDVHEGAASIIERLPLLSGSRSALTAYKATLNNVLQVRTLHLKSV